MKYRVEPRRLLKMGYWQDTFQVVYDRPTVAVTSVAECDDQSAAQEIVDLLNAKEQQNVQSG